MIWRFAFRNQNAVSLLVLARSIKRISINGTVSISALGKLPTIEQMRQFDNLFAKLVERSPGKPCRFYLIEDPTRAHPGFRALTLLTRLLHMRTLALSDSYPVDQQIEEWAAVGSRLP